MTAIIAIIPKINAISRMDHMTNVNIIPKFLNDFEHSNLNTLSQIEEINQLRKTISTDCANRLALKQYDDDIVLIYEEGLIEGLCGLIANNLVNKIKKPVIVLTKSNGLIKGSARSIDGYDLHGVLKRREDLFITDDNNHEITFESYELIYPNSNFSEEWSLEKVKAYLERKDEF